MLHKFTRHDIELMIKKEYDTKVEALSENLKVFSGKKRSDRKPFLSQGFKIKHNKSGLIYTVIRVLDEDTQIFLLCIKPNGKAVKIPDNLFKDYSRL